MILSIHALTGAALGSYGVNPVSASILGLVSHYFIDYLPHFEYKIDNIKQGDWRLVYWEILKISIDLIITSAIIIFIIYKNPEQIMSILSSSFFALFPDGLVLLHFIFRKNPPQSFFEKFLIKHYEFHGKIHSKTPSVNIFSIFTQILIITASLAIIFR